MKTFTKTLALTVAAGVMVVSAAAPAAARDHRDRDGISAGEVIAGALVIGGIAAVAASVGSNRDRGYSNDYNYGRAGYDGHQRGDGWDNDRGYGNRYDWGGYGNRYDRGGYGNPRQAVEMCVNVAERTASRYSHGRANVTDVRDIDRNDRGYTVRGRIAVNSAGRDWRNGDSRYGRGWGGDYRGYNDSMRGYDSGSFKCRVEYGRVVDVDFSGLRGL